MRRIRSVLGVLSVLAAGLGLGSCSSFDQKYHNMPAPLVANPAAQMAGKWEGTWQSDTTAYWGHLKAIIVPTNKTMRDGVEVQQYHVEWQQQQLGEFWPREMNMTLEAAKMPDGRLHFEGEKDQGYEWGGIYKYDGYVDPDKNVLYCDFASDGERGTWKLRRLAAENH